LYSDVAVLAERQLVAVMWQGTIFRENCHSTHDWPAFMNPKRTRIRLT
jgi:hypothetical protein